MTREGDARDSTKLMRWGSRSCCRDALHATSEFNNSLLSAYFGEPPERRGLPGSKVPFPDRFFRIGPPCDHYSGQAAPRRPSELSVSPLLHHLLTDCRMPLGDRLFAWIEPRNTDGFMAALVGGGAQQRVPATQLFRSPDEARRWVEAEAAALGVPVEWLPRDRRRRPRRA